MSSKLLSHLKSQLAQHGVSNPENMTGVRSIPAHQLDLISGAGGGRNVDPDYVQIEYVQVTFDSLFAQGGG